MRKTLIYFFFIAFVFLTACGNKKEEVKVFRNSGADNTGDSSVQVETQKQSGADSLSAAGNVLNIASGEAAGHIGGNAIVKGYVADVVVREKVAYLNFDKKYPKNTFTAVIFESKFSEVGDLSIYKNQNVEIEGIITEYKGKPQIIVSNKNQIRIVK